MISETEKIRELTRRAIHGGHASNIISDFDSFTRTAFAVLPFCEQAFWDLYAAGSYTRKDARYEANRIMKKASATFGAAYNLFRTAGVDCFFPVEPAEYKPTKRPTPTKRPAPAPEPLPEPVSREVMLATLRNYGQNSLFLGLVDRFPIELVKYVFTLYYVGTSRYLPGCCIFWHVDKDDNPRRGKIMLYDRQSVKRDKAVFNWVHKVSNQVHDAGDCLYGEHLLTGNQKPVCVVESEKTALICALFFPKYVWLATGGKERLTIARFSRISGLLANRKVFLVPDVDGQEKWQQQAAKLQTAIPACKVFFAPPEKFGLSGKQDIADALISTKMTATPAPAEYNPTPTPTPAPAEYKQQGRLVDELKRINPAPAPLSWIDAAEIKNMAGYLLAVENSFPDFRPDLPNF